MYFFPRYIVTAALKELNTLHSLANRNEDELNAGLALQMTTISNREKFYVSRRQTKQVEDSIPPQDVFILVENRDFVLLMSNNSFF